MSDILEDVARKMYAEAPWQFPFDKVDLRVQDQYREAASIAIAAATPHIRAALFDELIAASNKVLSDEGHYYWGYVDVTGWLEMKKEEENTQP